MSEKDIIGMVVGGVAIAPMFAVYVAACLKFIIRIWKD